MHNTTCQATGYTARLVTYVWREQILVLVVVCRAFIFKHFLTYTLLKFVFYPTGIKVTVQAVHRWEMRKRRSSC